MHWDYPRRIVCLTEETTETLYLLGAQDRIVGISGFVVRPPEARKEKTIVSGFTNANIDAIMALEPDLVLGFSDLQGEIARKLVAAGIEVHVFNQRDVAGILRMIATVGALVGAADRGRALADELGQRIDQIREQTSAYPRRPRIYFEEWDDPLISGIAWVSELIGIAGGEDCFPELASQPLASHRIISDPAQVVRRQPDIIVASWCGKKFQPDRLVSREGWDRIPAVREHQIFEIKAPLILAPGPAALTDGLDELCRIVRQWVVEHGRE